MKVDGHLTADWAGIPDHIKLLESEGFDGVGTAEMNHDPFFPLLIAAEHSENIQLQTGIAVAFARSPMTLANQGHDLNAYSKGRFTLGLGSQIRAHITKRFSMPWGAPALQMRELILAMPRLNPTMRRALGCALRCPVSYTHLTLPTICSV